MTLIETIQSHPKIALVVGLVHILMAETLRSIEIPGIVMQVFQLGAWTITSLVGIITIVGIIKRKINERI